jgi:1-acyl-sn-glycerol-3-phosphate acyltransferase
MDRLTDVVSIQPAALFYSSPHAGWTGDATLLPHLWDILRKPPLQVSVVFGQPLAYARTSDRKVLCAAAKLAIAELLREHRVEAGNGLAHVVAPWLEQQTFNRVMAVPGLDPGIDPAIQASTSVVPGCADQVRA